MTWLTILEVSLAALEGGYKIATDLYSGDKIKFIVSMAFKCGFYCFLITEWLNIGQALSGFFQVAGFLAAGESGFSMADPTSADFDKTFRPDSIWHNAWAFLELCISGKGASGEAKNTGFGFVDALDQEGVAGMFSLAGGVIISPIAIILVTIAIVCALIFTSVEMFVARIEFYTMLMLSVVFLPFGVTERQAFLSNSAISLMFNSGAKMMVICFLQVMIAKIFSAYLVNLTANPFKSFSILVQMCVMSVFFAYITKKIPDLVSSFLNGSPALSGGGMISQAKGMATQTAAVLGTAGGAVAGASAASTAAKARHAASGKPTTMMSQLKNSTAGMLARGVAQNVMARNPLTQGYASGMKSMVGSDGSLQNEKFMKGVRQLAGLEAADHGPDSTKSLSKLASDPEHKQKPKGSEDSKSASQSVKARCPAAFPRGIFLRSVGLQAVLKARQQAGKWLLRRLVVATIIILRGVLRLCHNRLEVEKKRSLKKNSGQKANILQARNKQLFRGRISQPQEIAEWEEVHRISPICSSQ